MSMIIERYKEVHWATKAVFTGTVILFLALVAAFVISLNGGSNDPTLDDLTTNQIKAVLRNETGLNVKTVKANEESGLVTISYLDDDVWDDNDVVYNVARDAEAIVPLMLKLPDVKRIKVVELGSFGSESDKTGGKITVEPSASLTLDREKIDDIDDWSTISDTNKGALIEMATELYIHPAIREQLDDENLLNSIIIQLSTH